jgi:hypothetical protein
MGLDMCHLRIGSARWRPGLNREPMVATLARMGAHDCACMCIGRLIFGVCVCVCVCAETHIRIALERGNLGDFAKCLSPLLELYHQAHQQVGSATRWSNNANEFVSYRCGT